LKVNCSAPKTNPERVEHYKTGSTAQASNVRNPTVGNIRGRDLAVSLLSLARADRQATVT
jgi:hypothetical protein